MTKGASPPDRQLAYVERNVRLLAEGAKRSALGVSVSVCELVGVRAMYRWVDVCRYVSWWVSGLCVGGWMCVDM